MLWNGLFRCLDASIDDELDKDEILDWPFLCLPGLRAPASPFIPLRALSRVATILSNSLFARAAWKSIATMMMRITKSAIVMMITDLPLKQ
jgi:hypothetical protein